MNIITGYRGEPHITSDQDRDANQGSYGTGSYILDVGAKMAATIISANEVRIADGILSHQGCLGSIDKGQYESCTIANGTQGMKRSDLIVCRYEKDSETNVESLSLVVIQGTPSSSTPSDPSYNTGNIQSGASPVDFPLYRVNINGVTISSVTRLASFVRTQKEMDTLLGGTSISDIGGGTVTGAIATLSGTGISNPIADANNATGVGVLYSADGSTANTPYSAYWVLWNHSYSTSFRAQYAQVVNTKYTIIYARSTDGNNSWGDWKKIADTRAVTVSASGLSVYPTVREGSGMATLEFALKLPARTYTDGDTLWTVSRAPSGTIHFITMVGADARLFRLNSDGTIVSNSTFTLSGETWMIGHVTYPFA